MDLEYIEDLIDREKINLIDTYLEETPGAYAKYKKLNVIFCDNSKLNNSLERKQTLSEELGHYYFDATYKFNSNIDYIGKQEYRAKKWSYNVLVPFEKLKSAISNRI